jgi:hypothetical protein
MQMQLQMIKQAAEEGREKGGATRSWQEALQDVKERSNT